MSKFSYQNLDRKQQLAPASFKTCQHVALHFAGGVGYQQRTPAQWNLFRNLRSTLYDMTKSKKKSEVFTMEKANALLQVNKLPSIYKKAMEDFLEGK